MDTLILLYTIIQIFLMFSDVTASVKCPQDNSRLLCTPIQILKIICANGIVPGPCSHCQICAKGRGESCGGEMYAHGSCGDGLTCYERPGEVGKCHQKVTPSRLLLNGGDHLFKCRHKCTHEFCSKHPDEICSAIDVRIIPRDCQGTCQHTHCQACYFKIKRESPCPRCSRDDTECFKRFGKCIRHETCTRHKYPCQSNHRRAVDGRFVCKVPACS